MKRHRLGMNRPMIFRLMTILDELRAKDRRKPVNCISLAKLLETSSKTVQRDIDFLRDSMGLPIQYDERSHGFALQEKPEGSFFDIARRAAAKWMEAA